MMNAVEASERLIELIRGPDGIARYSSGCEDRTIAAAERELGAALPPSYRRLIQEFGTWEFAGEEFLGIYQTRAMGAKLLGTVIETLEARDQFGMPTDLIVVMSDGMGGLVVLDASQVDQDGEYPVLVWNPGCLDRDSMERLGDNFGSFALDIYQDAVSRRRAST
jgi:hypothetical protein